MKYSNEHKKEIINSLDNAVVGFMDFIELAYEYENNHNLDEDYPNHSSEIHFTDKSFDDFVIGLSNYRNHLASCFEEEGGDKNDLKK